MDGEFKGTYEQIKRAIAVSEKLNSLPHADSDAIHEAWAELTGIAPDPTFRLIPPVYSQFGLNIRIGRQVFINQGCHLMDLGGIEIGDEVMIGPAVKLISGGHPLSPAERRSRIT